MNKDAYRIYLAFPRKRDPVEGFDLRFDGWEAKDSKQGIYVSWSN